VLAHAWNETLGGLTFDLRVTEHLANEFQATLAKKVKGAPNVRTLPRVMARLRTTANRAKEVLSANKETPVYVCRLAMLPHQKRSLLHLLTLP
jgi:molecular chaperone DnaK (HSP70)